jgi:hypothetical protein
LAIVDGLGVTNSAAIIEVAFVLALFLVDQDNHMPAWISQ